MAYGKVVIAQNTQPQGNLGPYRIEIHVMGFFRNGELDQANRQNPFESLDEQDKRRFRRYDFQSTRSHKNCIGDHLYTFRIEKHF